VGVPKSVATEVKKMKKIKYISQCTLASHLDLSCESWKARKKVNPTNVTSTKPPVPATCPSTTPSKSTGLGTTTRRTIPKPNQCAFCKGFGHWKNECPQLKKKAQTHHLEVEKEKEDVENHGANTIPLGSNYDDMGDVEAIGPPN